MRKMRRRFPKQRCRTVATRAPWLNPADVSERQRLAQTVTVAPRRMLFSSVPARLGKGQGAKEIGHNLASEQPKFGHNLVRERHIIGHSLEHEWPKFGRNPAHERNEVWAQFYKHF